VSFFLVGANDEYGGYRSAQRSSAALAALVYGLNAYGLKAEAEVILVDWQPMWGKGKGSASPEPLRCTPEFRKVLARVPLVCEGPTDGRACRKGLVRIVEVPPNVAYRYSKEAVSEVHAFNLAARRSRGRHIFRVDQDTLTLGPFFRWLHWQKVSNWTDLNHVIWKARDFDIKREQVPTLVDDLHFYINHHTTTTAADGQPAAPCIHGAHGAKVPARPPYDKANAKGGGANWGECHNQAVGVLGLPIELVKDIRGMNEALIHWGGMEAELCTRASQSPKFINWVDISKEVCGYAFAHMTHDYAHHKNGEVPGQAMGFANTADWGLAKERSIREYVF